MNLLLILVLATSLQHTSVYTAMRVALPYATRFTCEEAEQRINTDFIKEFAQINLNKGHKQHVKVRKVATACVSVSSIII